MRVSANTPRDPYERPHVWTYGTLAELTSADSLLLPFAQGGVGNLSAVMSSGGPSDSGGVGTEVVTPVAVPTGGGGGGEVPGSADMAPSGGADVAAANPATPGPQSGGSGEDTLPFTGFAAGALSAAGAGLAAIGVALRRVANRR